jgi:hypothetical protein
MKIRIQAVAALAAATVAAAALAAGLAGPDLLSSGADAATGSRATGAQVDAAPQATTDATAAKQPKPLRLARAVGGDLAEPLVSGDLVYVPAGRTLAVWDYTRPQAPRQAGSAELAPGVIQGLARRGTFLYASWRTSSCQRGGVTVYSLANPRQPRAVGEVAQYAGKVERTCAAGLVIAKNRLYLFDTENDLYVGSLADPKRPRLLPAGIGPGAGTKVAAGGNLIWAGGRSFLGGYLLRSIDISVPDVPREAAFYSSPGTDMVNVSFKAPYAYGVGHSMSVLDLADPAQINVLGQAEMPYGAWSALAIGDHVYTGGFHGLDVWSVASPSQPAFLANHDLRTFSVRTAVPLRAGYGLMLGSDDRLIALDARNPAKPAFASERLQPGGVNAMDVAHVDGYAVLLQYDYGLTVADPRTLAPLARLEPDRPDDFETRGYTGMAVRGHTAYLAVWGYGLIVVDLSAPLKPREIGRLEYPFASSVEVVGQRLYLGKNTNGPTLGVVDIADPANPVLLSNWSVPDAPWAMAAKGRLLFAAEAGTYDLAGGVRVLDMRDPANVTQLARWEGDCESATDVQLDASGKRLYVACRSGLRILDVRDPAAPKLIGGTWANSEASTFAAVAVRGERAWYGSAAGIEEYDVSMPRSPRLLRRTNIAGYEPIHLRTAPDGGLLATTYSAGVHMLAK